MNNCNIDITLNGCDDTIECEIELTNEQFEIFIQIAKETNKKSTYVCELSISVYEKYEKDDDGYFHYWDKECVDSLESKGE